MEEKTLQELNDEYKSLVKKVGEIKIELEKAIAEKNTADENYGKAADDFTTKKTTYEALEVGLQKIENSGFSATLVEGMKEEIKVAKEAMEEAERVLAVRDEEQKRGKEKFEKIEADSKKEANRLDVILVSFASNKVVNDVISNQIEIDYTEMVAKKQEEKNEYDNLKTKINDDAKIQEQVTELDSLLKNFEELKKNVTPENAQKLAETAEKIKKQRKVIRTRIRTLGLKNGKISAEEIDKMTTDRDAQGRIVIAELDRRVDVTDIEIANIEIEKKELLDKMKASLELGVQAEHDDTEEAKLKSEIDELTAEKETLEKEQRERNTTLEEIESKKAALIEEEQGLEKSQIDTVELNKLRADRDAIEAETIEKIDNPKKIELKTELEKLKREKEGNNTSETETADYKKAKSAYDIAKRNLQNEKNWPKVAFAQKTDEIVDNPEYISKSAELATREKELSRITGIVVGKNPELKKLFDDWHASRQQEEELDEELKSLTEEMLEKQEILTGEYVSEELYPDLENPDSEASKLFEVYKNSELELRKAMAAVQKEPSTENVEALMNAMAELKQSTEDFQKGVSNSASFVNYPSAKAIHKYLLGKLKDAYDEFEPIDEGYDLNQAERRIAILEAQTKRDEKGKENIASLRESSKGLEDALNEMLVGNVVDDRILINLITKHQNNINAFENPEAAKSTLKGVDIEVADGRFGFLKRFISRFTTPKVDERYKFSANKEPASKEAYEDVFFRCDEVKEELDARKEETKQIGLEYSAKMKEVATKEQLNDIEDNRSKIAKLKRNLINIPQKINKTRMEKLEEELRVAEEKLNSTPRYQSNSDRKSIDDKIAEITTKLEAEPDQIDNPEQVASKKRRIAEKEAMIDEAMIDATDPRRIEIKGLLEELNNNEIKERSRLEEISNRLNGITTTLKEKYSLLSILEVARQKVMNLIHIKNPNSLIALKDRYVPNELIDAVTPKPSSRGEVER